MTEFHSRHYGEDIDDAIDKVDDVVKEFISDAPANNQLHGRINKTWQPIPAHSVDLMFFGIENGYPVATHTAPIQPQTILPITYFSASPGVWHNIIVFTIGRDLHGTELEFVPGNSFTAKFWIQSDIARNGAQFRLTATNIRTGDSLATGTVSVDLGQTGISSPVLITGIYEIPAVVPAEDVQMILQVLTPLFGVQFGIISIPPNEISYISRLIASIPIGLPEKKYPAIYSADLSKAGNQIIIALALDDYSEDQIFLRYRYSTANDISIAIKSVNGNNLVDVKRATQYGLTGIEGSTIDNELISTTYQTIDSLVYNESQEMHRIWLRFKDYLDNNLWSVYEINCFCSADAKRTDIWVNPIYQSYIGIWK